MTYIEAMKSQFTYEEVAQEIARHGQLMADFVADFGSRLIYNGSDVLDWLGY